MLIVTAQKQRSRSQVLPMTVVSILYCVQQSLSITCYNQCTKGIWQDY